MNFTYADYVEKPWLPWKDQSTADAYQSLRESYEAALLYVDENSDLTDSEKESRIKGIKIMRDLAFARYGGSGDGLAS